MRESVVVRRTTPSPPTRPSPAPAPTTAGPARAPGLATAAAVPILACYFAVRPVLDALVTFDVGPDVNALVGLVLLATTGFVVAARLIADPDDRLTPAQVAALALAGAAGLSALGSGDLGQSIGMALRVLAAALLFVAVQQLSRLHGRAAVVPLLVAILVGYAGSAVVASLQVVGILPLPDGLVTIENRPSGPSEAPTVFGTSMFLTIVLLVAALPNLRRPGARFATGLAAMAAASLLVLNASRAPFVATGLALAYLAWRNRRLELLLLAIAGGATVLALAPDTTARVSELGEADVVTGENTLTFRFTLWRENLPRVADSPIVGIGLGRVEQITTWDDPPHNTWVQALVEMGVLGLAAHLAVVGTLARDLARRLRSVGVDPVERWVVDAAVAALAGYALLTLTENLMTQLVTTGPVAAITGAALGLRTARS